MVNIGDKQKGKRATLKKFENFYYYFFSSFFLLFIGVFYNSISQLSCLSLSSICFKSYSTITTLYNRYHCITYGIWSSCYFYFFSDKHPYLTLYIWYHCYIVFLLQLLILNHPWTLCTSSPKKFRYIKYVTHCREFFYLFRSCRWLNRKQSI